MQGLPREPQTGNLTDQTTSNPNMNQNKLTTPSLTLFKIGFNEQNFARKAITGPS